MGRGARSIELYRETRKLSNQLTSRIRLVRSSAVYRRRAPLALAGPSFLWTLLFFLAPLAILVVYSFGQIDTITLQPYFGWTLDNYERVGEPLYRCAVARSLLLSAAATGLCLLVGYPLAYWISTLAPARQRLALLLIIVPFWTSYLVRTYAMASLLSNGGPLERVLQTLGVIDGPLNLLYSREAVAVGIVYSYLPLMVLPLYVALERIDSSLRQAASDLGAPPRRVFRRVILPLSVPGIVAGCLLVGIPATGEYVIPIILGGDKTLMFSNIISNQFFEVGDYAFGSALAVSLMAGVTVAALIGRKFTSSREDIL
jgi:ABC-type spermidine/putrescine transport system permease subunit I